MTSSRQIRERLLGRLTELGARVERIEAEQGAPLDPDFAEQAISREDDEVLDAVERSALAEIEQLRHALGRLDAGHYGQCTTCGQPIEPARLEAVPTALQCMMCAKA